MSKASVVASKFQSPLALAIHIAIGFIETARNPASSVFAGVLGTIAANISTTAPIHEIAGEMLWFAGSGAQWNVRPRANAVNTM